MSELCTNLDDIRAAARRIAPHAHRTPELRCTALDSILDAKLSFKCENFQKVGAFKFRGACNAVMSLQNAELKRGVATHSSGNHAAALALAAKLAGSTAHIVMPSNASPIKKAAVAGYGATITFCEPTLLTSLGDLTFPILQERCAGIVTVAEESIVEAMRLVWERMKIIIEPSSAVPIAALLEMRGQIPGQHVGVILSGGNVDLDGLPWR